MSEKKGYVADWEALARGDKHPPQTPGEGAVVLWRNRDGALLNENQLPYEHGKHAAEREKYEPVTYIPASSLREEVEWLRETANSIEAKAEEIAGSLPGFRGEPALRGLAEDRRNRADRIEALLPPTQEATDG